MNCPGSPRLIASIPTPPTPYVAAEGTFAHAIATACIETGEKLDLWLGRKAIVDGHEITCDEEMIEGIGLYLATIQKNKLDTDWVELSLHSALRSLDPDLGGTADYVTYSPGLRLLRIIDFKYGAGVFVSADDNKQLKKYALGAMLTIEAMRTDAAPVQNIEVYIVQPRYEGAEPVRVEKFAASDLIDFVGDMLTAAKKTRDPDAPTIAGPWCKKTFCPAAHICPALLQLQHSLVECTAPGLPALDPSTLGDWLTVIPLVEERIKAVRESAYQQALTGVKIPGWKLVDKRPRRCWTEPDKVIAWAKGRAIEPFETPELKSPAQMEKGLKAAEKRELAAWVASVSSGTTLAPESDPRQPVSKAISVADFDVVGGSASKQIFADNIFE